MQNKYFVYTESGLRAAFTEYHTTCWGFQGGLLGFVNRETTPVFGNSFNNRRQVYDQDSRARYTGEPELKKVKYVVYELIDQELVLIPVKQLERDLAYEEYHRRGRLAGRLRYQGNRRCLGEDYRNGLPVPGVHNYGSGNYYRPIRYAQELRVAFGDEEYIRAKRNRHNLPNAWDDFAIAAHRDKYSWKKQKKRKQWM